MENFKKFLTSINYGSKSLKNVQGLHYLISYIKKYVYMQGHLNGTHFANFFSPLLLFGNAWSYEIQKLKFSMKRKTSPMLNSLRKLCMIRRVEITQTCFNHLYFGDIFLRCMLKSLIWIVLSIKIKTWYFSCLGLVQPTNCNW